ncbi:uncharacterized protein LOC120943550 [Rana temporaria]|uniref:uncharacterized protein LOC120943550 n=1 Tax=Rana temporaria TaxID=8407 RepID=UPI001AAD8CBF|nr:uncharacterized protein LOC120943550 [Rana temporaria]
MGNKFGKEDSEGKLKQPSPIEFVKSEIPIVYCDPFWDLIMKRSHQLHMSGYSPVGPTNRQQWYEVEKMCGIGKNIYPPGDWDTEYMKKCFKKWRPLVEKYEKKYAELDQGTALTREVPPPYTRRPPPVPTSPTPPSYVFVKEEAPRRKLYPVLSNPQVAIMAYGSATDQQKQQWEDRAKEEADKRASEEGRRIREAQRRADIKREFEELQRDLDSVNTQTRIADMRNKRDEIEEDARRLREQQREINLRHEQMNEHKQSLDAQAQEVRDYGEQLNREKKEILARKSDLDQRKLELEKIAREQQEQLRLIEEQRVLTAPRTRLAASKAAKAAQQAETIREQQPDRESGDEEEITAPSLEGEMKHIAITQVKVQTEPQVSPQLPGTRVFPMMTIGTMEVYVPFTMGQLKDLRDTCPTPKKDPRGAATFLGRFCAGAGMTKEDLLLIIQMIDPDPGQDFPFDNTYKSALTTEGPINLQEFWRLTGHHWMTIYKGTSALTSFITSSQKTGEEYFAYVKRMHLAWKDAGLTDHTLFVTTTLNGGSQKIAQMLKILDPKIMNMTPEAFVEHVKVRHQTGLFEAKGGLFPALTGEPMLEETPLLAAQMPYQQQNQYPVGNQYPPRSVPYPRQGPQNDQACFHCGGFGHWKANCPQRRQNYRGKKGNRGAYRGQNPNWNDNRQIAQYPQWNQQAQSQNQPQQLQAGAGPLPSPQIPVQWPNRQNP